MKVWTHGNDVVVRVEEDGPKQFWLSIGAKSYGPFTSRVKAEYALWSVLPAQEREAKAKEPVASVAPAGNSPVGLLKQG